MSLMDEVSEADKINTATNITKMTNAGKYLSLGLGAQDFAVVAMRWGIVATGFPFFLDTDQGVVLLSLIC